MIDNKNRLKPACLQLGKLVAVVLVPLLGGCSAVRGVEPYPEEAQNKPNLVVESSQDGRYLIATVIEYPPEFDLDGDGKVSRAEAKASLQKTWTLLASQGESHQEEECGMP